MRWQMEVPATGTSISDDQANCIAALTAFPPKLCANCRCYSICAYLLFLIPDKLAIINRHYLI
ncbi:hypothetical protein A5320_01215 [Rheinheimera sp. SA_1]|nr:hypothetical protein A5320_01215 [Rheinheimera sp. SA_1]